MAIQPIQVNAEFIAEMDKLRVPSDPSLLPACSKSVIVFAERMLGLRLYAWQVYFLNKLQRAMEDPTAPREYCAITSRQIGKSTAIAVLALWACAFNKKPGTIANNTIFGITSASEIQARKLLGEIDKLMRIGDAHMNTTYKGEKGSVFGEKFFSKLRSPNDPNNTTTITFKAYEEGAHGLMLKGSKSGSVIKSYPPTNSILGETFTFVVIDEAGLSDRISDEFYYEYIYPTGNSTNAVRANLSTPWAASGFFYRLVDPDGLYGESPADVVCFDVDSIQIENPDYRETLQKIIDQMNKDGKVDEVQRAYFCRFVKAEQSYFNPTKVWECFTPTLMMKQDFREPCDMGIDFGGQVKSRSVITISRLNDNGIVERIYHKWYEVGADGDLMVDVAVLLKRFNVQRIIPDECPQGDFMIRQMREKGWPVEPMNFRTDKVKKYGSFRSMLNKNKIQSYNDDVLKTEMLALEYSHHKRQSVIEHAPGYSDDFIDSFLLSCYFFLDEDDGVKTFSIAQEVKMEPDSCYACGCKKWTVVVSGNRKCKECGYEWQA